MLMILARLVRSESFWAVVKVRSPHNRPEVWYPRHWTSIEGARQRRELGPVRSAAGGVRTPLPLITCIVAALVSSIQ